MNKEIHQAAVDALQGLILDVLGSTAKDKYVRLQRLGHIAVLLQREKANGVDDVLNTNNGRRQGGLVLNGPVMAQPQYIPQLPIYGDEEPAPFVNVFDQGDNGEIERNKMLSATQLTHILKEQVESTMRGNDAREEEGLTGEMANLLSARKDCHPENNPKDVFTLQTIDRRIDHITKRLKEKTDAASVAKNSVVVHSELVWRHPSIDGGSKDSGDGGAVDANGGAGAGGATEESARSGMEAGAVVRRE